MPVGCNRPPQIGEEIPTNRRNKSAADQFFSKTGSLDLSPGPKYAFFLAALLLGSCGKPEYASIFRKDFHPAACKWSLSISLQEVVSTLVLYVQCDKPIGGGLIPAQTRFGHLSCSSQPDGKFVFPCTNKACHKKCHKCTQISH